MPIGNCDTCSFKACNKKVLAEVIEERDRYKTWADKLFELEKSADVQENSALKRQIEELKGSVKRAEGWRDRANRRADIIASNACEMLELCKRIILDRDDKVSMECIKIIFRELKKAVDSK